MSDDAICGPHMERLGVSVPARYRPGILNRTPMCDACYRGKPVVAEVEEKVPTGRRGLEEFKRWAKNRGVEAK